MNFKINITKLKQYIRSNPGSPFVFVFQVLLVTCAAFLIKGQSDLAEKVGNYSYYFLVIGVALQIFSFIRNNDEGESSEV